MITMMLMMRMITTTTNKSPIAKTTPTKTNRKKTITTKTIDINFCFGFFAICAIIRTLQEVEWFPLCMIFSKDNTIYLC